VRFTGSEAGIPLLQRRKLFCFFVIIFAFDLFFVSSLIACDLFCIRPV